jgi:uncharacterized protein DUF3617
MISRGIVLVACVLAVSSGLVAQGPMRDGLWEITTQMEMPNMPMKMPPMRQTQCITKDQLKDPAQTVPSGSQPGQPNDCKVSDFKMEGNKASWKIICTGREKMTGVGEITYKGDTYDGQMKLTMSAGEMLMKYSAKRLGECTK